MALALRLCPRSREAPWCQVCAQGPRLEAGVLGPRSRAGEGLGPGGPASHCACQTAPHAALRGPPPHSSWNEAGGGAEGEP